jgi:mRNA-degrading endonuclease RelE of RelBE toxin-antitoxin system
MQFLISDSFTDSLARLTGEEQKAVKTTAFDLQLNPASPGMSFHKLDRAKDKNFWSVRVNSDIRLIVHKTEASLLLCYVGHHHKAYGWAERRKLETHPKTGAAQLVEIRETVQEIRVPDYERHQPAKSEKPPLFAQLSDDMLLGYGVPVEWIGDVKNATDDTLLVLAGHLPAEAGEALLELATGGRPRVPQLATAVASIQDALLSADAEPRVLPRAIAIGSPFDHPDAQRRFRIMASVQELQRSLDFPWDKWTVFLHPDQREWVERDYAGPARVSGSAGTGKTVVALHRAHHLARTHPDARVLLTTFSDALANALRAQLRRLLSSEPRLAERIDVHSLNSLGLRLYKAHLGQATIASPEAIRNVVREASSAVTVAATSSHSLFSSANGNRWSMRGSSRAGRRIAMFRAWAGGRGFRKHSARSYGPSSSAFAAVCSHGSSSPMRACSARSQPRSRTAGRSCSTSRSLTRLRTSPPPI